MKVRIPPNALDNLEHLQPLKDERDETGIFLDLDGTLCQIVDAPDAVEMPSLTRRYLEALSAKHKIVVIISGRAASTLLRIVNIPSIIYVGNHGLEIIEGGKRRILLPEGVAARMRSLGETLRSSIDCEGILLELKELSHAIHYRRAANPVKARECILRELDEIDLAGVRMTEGKLLVQLRPEYPLDKGKALELLVKERGIRRILYAGDDTTDLDAFRSVAELVKGGSLRGYRIAVRHPDSPARLLQLADYSVEGVEEMQQLLEWTSS
ncbi:MAG: trehalose-phosphatase [Candidatus Thermoplasmatota archaeon]|nr:trehalose-phosphatase [Candidatus Thermoplasmatota archaeon]